MVFNKPTLVKFDVRSRHTEINMVRDHMMVTVVVETTETTTNFDCTLINLLNGEELCFFMMKLDEGDFQVHESNGKDLYIAQEIIAIHKESLINEFLSIKLTNSKDS